MSRIRHLYLETGTMSHHTFGSIAIEQPLLAEDNTILGARLLVAADHTETTHDVSIGDTFPVGDQTWRLDSVDAGDRLGANLTRIT